MNRSINEKPMLFGIDSKLLTLIITIGAAIFFWTGSIKVPIACILFFISARTIYWYDPQFFEILGGYLSSSDLSVGSESPVAGKTFSSVLPWERIEGSFGTGGCIIRNMDGSYQTTFQLIGLDFLSSSETEIKAAFSYLNESFKLLSESEITICFECRRVRCQHNSEDSGIRGRDLPYALSLMCEEQTELFRDAGVYENEHYLTIVYRDDASRQKVSRFANFFLTSAAADQSALDISGIEQFKSILEQFKNLVSVSGFDLVSLNRAQTKDYLHSCISNRPLDTPDLMESGENRPLSETLPNVALIKGLNPLLGKEFIKTVGFRSMPDPLDERMREAVSGLPMEFRWVIRADILGKEQARKIVKARRTTWSNNNFNWSATLASMFTSTHVDMTEKFESRMSDECRLIMDELKEGGYALCHINSVFITADVDESKAEEKADTIKKTLENHGVVACIEGLNTIQSYLSSIPGTFHKNPRQFFFKSIDLTSLFLPLNKSWQGSSSDESCLFVAKGRD